MSALDEIKMFEFAGSQIRTFYIDGESWWVATDVARALGLSNSRAMVGRLRDNQKGVRLIDTLGGRQESTTVNESGLYSAILRSDSPRAIDFQIWVTDTVLPAIRKTGTYAVEQSPELQIANALVLASSMIAAKDAQIGALTPRADAWDELASASGDYEVADAAKILARAGVETGQARLFKQLAELAWIHRGAQGKWKAYQSSVDAGYLAEKPMSHYHPKSGELVLDPPQVRVTVRGLERLRVRLGTLQLVS